MQAQPIGVWESQGVNTPWGYVSEASLTYNPRSNRKPCNREERIFARLLGMAGAQYAYEPEIRIALADIHTGEIERRFATPDYVVSFPGLRIGIEIKRTSAKKRELKKTLIPHYAFASFRYEAMVVLWETRVIYTTLSPQQLLSLPWFRQMKAERWQIKNLISYLALISGNPMDMLEDSPLLDTLAMTAKVFWFL